MTQPVLPPTIEPPPGYELERLLGRGAFGEVYLARETALGRRVALKFLAVEGAAQVERFHREAQFAARLEHPSIVRVYALGAAGERPFIAMQYVEGGSLADAALDQSAVLAAVRAAADALGYAHGQGLVHRDVKPANILVDNDGRAYVTDFGIARDVSHDAADTLSPEGAIMGTPGLMAPEQARGDLRSIDARTDVYGLGATLFMLLTGEYPFAGDNVIEVLHKVLRATPRRPSSLNPRIPASLDEVVVRCLQKDSGRRYPSMAAFADDLERATRGDTVAPGGGSWFFAKVRERLPEAPVRDTGGDLSLVVSVSHELAAWDARLYRISSNVPRTWGQLDGLRERLDEVLASRPDFALARFYRGLAHFRRGDLEAALEDMERSIDRVGEMPSAHFELGRLYLSIFLREHELARGHLSQAGVETHIGEVRNRLDQAVLAFGAARRGGTGLLEWQPQFADAVTRLAEGDLAGCIARCDEILADDPDVEDVWKLRGDAQRSLGQDPCESYERAAEVRRSFHEALMAKAAYLVDTGRLDEARAALERVLRILPGHATATAMLGRVLLSHVQTGGERALLTAALEHASAATRADPESYDAMVTRAEILLELGADASRAADLDAALDTIDAGRSLVGCPNRLGLLRAKVHLARARHSRSPTDLEYLKGLRPGLDHEPPAGGAWDRLLDEVDAFLAG